MKAAINILILAAAMAAGFFLTQALESRRLPGGHEAQAPQDIPQKPQPQAAAMQQPLPAFSFAGIDGRPHASTDFPGRIILLNFWASWCPPCVAEFPQLLELAALYPDDLVLIAISSDSDDEAIRNFIDNRLGDKERDILSQRNVIIARDDGESRITFGLFGSVMLPETIIADRNGTMVRKLTGADWSIEDVKSIVSPAGP